MKGCPSSKREREKADRMGIMEAGGKWCSGEDEVEKKSLPLFECTFVRKNASSQSRRTEKRGMK